MSVAKRLKVYFIQNNISQTWVSEQSKIALPKLNASLNEKRKLDVEEFTRILTVINEDANKFIYK